MMDGRYGSYRAQSKRETLLKQLLVFGVDKVVSQFLDDGDGLRLLIRGDNYGNQDSLLRFDEDTAVSLISLTPRRRSGE